MFGASDHQKHRARILNTEIRVKGSGSIFKCAFDWIFTSEGSYTKGRDARLLDYVAKILKVSALETHYLHLDNCGNEFGQPLTYLFSYAVKAL